MMHEYLQVSEAHRFPTPFLIEHIEIVHILALPGG